MRDFGYPAWQIATLLTHLQCHVDSVDLLQALAKVARPHLVVDVLVPHSRVDYGFTLHGASNFVKNVSLARIFGQVITEFIFEDFKENDLFLLIHY